MDLKQLEFALAVVEEGGFTAAARRLHTVQSTVSSTVSALERDLGVTLFERTTRQVRLTEPGVAFVPAARRALAAAQEVRTAARGTVPGLHGTVTVGTMQGLWPGLQRGMLAMSKEHPDVIVELRQAPAAVMQEEIRNGTLDLAVVALTSQEVRGLASRLLWKEPMVLVTGRADPIAGDDPVPLSAVAGQALRRLPGGVGRPARGRPGVPGRQGGPEPQARGQRPAQRRRPGRVQPGRLDPARISRRAVPAAPCPADRSSCAAVVRHAGPPPRRAT